MLALENKYKNDMEFIVANVTTEEGSLLAEKYNIYYIPVYFTLDPRGNIIDHIEFSEVQDSPRSKLEAYITKALTRK